MEEIEMVAQEPNVNIDVCVNIAEEVDDILSTLTNTLSTILQIKTSNLLNYVSNYVAITIGVATIFVAIPTVMLNIGFLLTSGWVLWVLITAIGTALAFLVVYLIRFRRILNKLLEGVEPTAKALKKIWCEGIEILGHYQKLLLSCYQKLCNDNNMNDLKISILCPRLYRLQKIDSNELSSLLLCS